MTALGKLMALFPGGVKKKRSGRHSVPHALHAFGCGGEKGKVGSGLLVFSFFFLHHNLTSVLSAAQICPTRRFRKVGSKWMT